MIPEDIQRRIEADYGGGQAGMIAAEYDGHDARICDFNLPFAQRAIL